MSNATQTFRGTATLENPTAPTIYNVTTSATPSTEASQALTAGTKQFTIRVRGNSELKLSYTSGQSGTLFITIPKRTAYTVSDINFNGTLFFQTSTGSQIVEIEEWSP